MKIFSALVSRPGSPDDGVTVVPRPAGDRSVGFSRRRTNDHILCNLQPQALRAENGFEILEIFA